MTSPQDPGAPGSGGPGDGFTGGPASDPGQGGYGSPDPQGGAPAGYPTPPGAGQGQGYGGPTAFGAPAGYGPPGPYGAPGYGGAPSPFGQPGGPRLASWGSRVGGALIDGGIVLGIVIVGVVLGAVLAGVSEALGGLVLALAYLAGIGFSFWQLWVQGQTGQTIGKRQVGIRLLREQDGQPIGGGLSIGRSFVHIVDQLPCFVGFLWPLWDDKKQTFADKILNTVVVKG